MDISSNLSGYHYRNPGHGLDKAGIVALNEAMGILINFRYTY
jgi:hypothetical protein